MEVFDFFYVCSDSLFNFEVRYWCYFKALLTVILL